MLKSKGKSDRQLKELKKLHWAPVAIFAGPVPPERLAKLKKAAR